MKAEIKARQNSHAVRHDARGGGGFSGWDGGV